MNNRWSLGLKFSLRLEPDVEAGREIYKENLLLLRLPKRRQLLGLKTDQTWGIEEQIIGIAKLLHIGVKVEKEAEANPMKMKFKLVKEAYGAGAW